MVIFLYFYTIMLCHDSIYFLCILFQANLVVQESKLAIANADLEKAQAELDEKQAELDMVQAQYEAAMMEKQVFIYNYLFVE